MFEHVKRTLNGQNIAHYLGKNIQNKVIYLISNSIRTKILEMIKESKYYSIILDCTANVSRTEQMTLIVHFVFIDLKNKRSNAVSYVNPASPAIALRCVRRGD